MAKYIVLGGTSTIKSSRRIIGRYKDVTELRDVFEVTRLRKPARRLLIFEVVDVIDDDTWYLISFDIKEVIGRKTGRPRVATKEYSIIKDRMYWCLCGRIDNSSYVCPEDHSDIPRRFTEYVEVWPVKPHDSRTLEVMREAVSKAVLYVNMQLLAMRTRLHGKGRTKAKEMLVKADTILASPWKPKVERLLGHELKLEGREALREAMRGEGKD